MDGLIYVIINALFLEDPSLILALIIGFLTVLGSWCLMMPYAYNLGFFASKAENTLFVSLGARFIFKKDLIKNFFKHNLVNFHSSRLPLDRAGGGFSWRIMREDRIENHENL